MRCKTQAHDPACCALDWAPTQMKTAALTRICRNK